MTLFLAENVKYDIFLQRIKKIRLIAQADYYIKGILSKYYLLIIFINGIAASLI